MKPRNIVLIFGSGVLVGCMAGGAPVPAQTGSQTEGVTAVPTPAQLIGTPLLIDRTEMRLGTTVHFNRIPNVQELTDLSNLAGLAHVVLALQEWPKDFAPLQPLDQLPYQADIIVVLAGWPPSRGAAEVWNFLNVSLRIIVVAPGPPPNADVVTELNAMTDLERVIVEMEYPALSGLERLRRPLSFRKVVN